MLGRFPGKAVVSSGLRQSCGLARCGTILNERGLVWVQGDQLAKPGTMKAFRSQLPRHNAYYGFEPPTQHDRLPRPLEVCDHIIGASGNLAVSVTPA